jgi:hypothetical protein
MKSAYTNYIGNFPTIAKWNRFKLYLRIVDTENQIKKFGGTNYNIILTCTYISMKHTSLALYNCIKLHNIRTHTKIIILSSLFATLSYSLKVY